MIAFNQIDRLTEIMSDVVLRGWSACQTANEYEALRLAEAFGQPVQAAGPSLIEELRIRESAGAPVRSLSAMHGTGGFPLHTDYAHWREPPRYIILRSNTIESVRPTIILPFDHLNLKISELKQLRRQVWKVSAVARPFLTRILRDTEGCEMLRFDLGCMAPAYASASTAAEILQNSIAAVVATHFEWTFGATLIVNNWRTLHGRSCASEPNDSSRVLQRIVVMRKGIHP